MIGFAFALAMLFGVLFMNDKAWDLGWLDYGEDSTHFTPVYFSIVTYTTLGFGDVTPLNNSLVGQALVTMEVIAGYFTLGLLVSMLADRVVRRA